MKTLHHVLTIVCMVSVAACSPQKQFYKFSFHRTKSPLLQQTTIESHAESPVVRVESGQLYQSKLSASASNQATKFYKPYEFKEDFPEINKLSSVNHKTDGIVGLERKSVSKSEKRFLRLLSAQKSEGDPKKNGWAVAGFVTSLVGVLLIWPLCIVGIVFSAMGLKSEKRGLAIAGLVIGVVGAAIILAAGLTGAI